MSIEKIRKGKRFATTIKPTYEANSGEKKTIPGQTMTLTEIAQRYIREQNVPQIQAIYQEAQDFAAGLDTFEAIDKARKEQKELQKKYAEMVERSNTILKNKEEALKRAEKQKIAAARKEKLEKAVMTKAGIQD